jgi:flagellin FlaB
MTNLARKFIKGLSPLGRDQRGITGLETAIVLIAFVVVSSVFAFAALSTGLFTTDKAKDTIHAGLSEA